MRTKAAFLTELKRRQATISEALPPQEYLLQCVEAMFDLGAEVLAEIDAGETKLRPGDVCPHCGAKTVGDCRLAGPCNWTN